MFHSRCRVNDKVCIIVIDKYTYTNYASTIVVEKLNLPFIKHCYEEVKVNIQVLMPFSMGKYKDELLYYVIHVHYCHIHWGDRDNLIGELSIMGSRICIHLWITIDELLSYPYPQKKCIQIKWDHLKKESKKER